MICIAFLTITPNKDLIDFAEKLSLYYHIYIFIDDNNYIIDTDINSKINFIKINNKECFVANYKYTQEPFYLNMINNIGKSINSWDKCMYYFCLLKTDYDYLWIFEDDVFIPSVNTIKDIDNEFTNYDLLTQRHELGTLNQALNNEWFWYYCSLYFKQPFYKSMVCCCRLSKKLMMLIKDYVSLHNFLPYHEFSFNTIAHHNNLLIGIPKQLSSSIIYRYEWKKEDFKIDKIYHPVKDYDNHNFYRNFIINSS